MEGVIFLNCNFIELLLHHFFIITQRYCFQMSIFINLNQSYFYIFTSNSARKIVFSRFWNIMESSKNPSKHYLNIKFLVKKKTLFPITGKFKIRAFRLPKTSTFQ